MRSLAAGIWRYKQGCRVGIPTSWRGAYVYTKDKAMCFKRCASNEVGSFAFEYAEPSWGAGGGWVAWTHLGAPRASSKGRFGVSFGSNFFGPFFFHGGDLGTVIVIRPQAGARRRPPRPRRHAYAYIAGYRGAIDGATR
jgi:hypothetical protein